MAKKLDYDNAFAELRDIVSKLQDADINIESLSQYLNRANELRQFCANRLREIEETIHQTIQHQNPKNNDTSIFN